MYRDKLNQVGKKIRETKESSDAALRRYSENFPKIERVRDVVQAGQSTVGTIDVNSPIACDFELYFKTKQDSNRVLLDLVFLPLCCSCGAEQQPTE